MVSLRLQLNYSATSNHTAWIQFANAELQLSLVPATSVYFIKASLFLRSATPQGGGITDYPPTN